MANWKLGKIQYSFTETATSGGTLTLVASSKMYQIFTGASSHTIKLPNATTLGVGTSFIVENNSTGTITVQNNGASVLATLSAGSISEFLITNISTSNGVWRTYSSGSSSIGGIGSVGPGAAKTADYTIVTGDKGKVINVNSSSGIVSITLPAPSSGFNITIKDSNGSSPTNIINILRSSNSVLIDGEINDDIINMGYGSISYISDGTNWFRISSYGGI